MDFRKIEDNGEVIYCAALYDGHGVSATVADLAQDSMLAHIEAELQKIGFNDLSEKVKTQVAWAICNAMCSCVRVFTQSNTPGTAHTSVCAYVYLGDQRARGITFFGSNYTASHGAASTSIFTRFWNGHSRRWLRQLTTVSLQTNEWAALPLYFWRNK